MPAAVMHSGRASNHGIVLAIVLPRHDLQHVFSTQQTVRKCAVGMCGGLKALPGVTRLAWWCVLGAWVDLLLSLPPLATCVMIIMVCRQDFTSGAVAICMSGGYKDNEDMGDTFVYTGAGGQEHQKQVSGYVVCSQASLVLMLCPAVSTGLVGGLATMFPFRKCVEGSQRPNRPATSLLQRLLAQVLHSPCCLPQPWLTQLSCSACNLGF